MMEFILGLSLGILICLGLSVVIVTYMWDR